MAVRKKRRKRKSLYTTVATVAVLIIMVIFGWRYLFSDDTPPDEDETTEVYEIPEGMAQFHFIDVGQGDSSLIATDGKYVLIDTGDVKGKDVLIKYLSDHSVTEIEYFVVTHPDSDHFASASYVLENYTVKNIIMTDFAKTTKTYETFIDTVSDKQDNNGLNVICANDNIGQKYYVGDLEIELLSPTKKYSDVNEASVVFMARFGNTKVLYTGDAEETPEADMINAYSAAKLDCDVLKVGHHGSRTSSSQGFLDVVKPEIAIISCGEGNDYGHPHSEALQRLEAISGIKIYRTDLLGSIVLESDGETVKKILPTEENKSETALAVIFPIFYVAKRFTLA